MLNGETPTVVLDEIIDALVAKLCSCQIVVTDTLGVSAADGAVAYVPDGTVEEYSLQNVLDSDRVHSTKTSSNNSAAGVQGVGDSGGAPRTSMSTPSHMYKTSTCLRLPYISQSMTAMSLSSKFSGIIN